MTDLKVQVYSRDVGTGWGYERLICVGEYVYQYIYDPNGFMTRYEFWQVPIKNGLLVPKQESDCNTRVYGTSKKKTDFDVENWQEVNSPTTPQWVKEWTKLKITVS